MGVRYGEIPFGQRAAFAPGALDLSVELSVSDPVTDASPLIPTESGPLPDSASATINAAAEAYVVNVQAWWQQYR